MECNICVEKFNKSSRLEIKCNYCDFSNCRSCFQKYLLETTDPYCMNCKKIFTRDFINEKCTGVFVSSDYKQHREKVLLEREKSYMPATQVYVVLEKDKDKIREEIKQHESRRARFLAQIQLVNNSISSCARRINELNVGNLPEEQERKKFIRKCPMENCRGFLSNQWKCGTCDTKICNKCNEERVEDHVCEEGKVATMELLNRDTKPCPECGTMIFRIEGCEQMFCVECHCAWNWNTGLVERGVIHNPHYYEFIRRGGGTGRNHGDIPCGGLPDLYTLRTVFANCTSWTVITPLQETMFYNFHNCITHIQHYEIRIVTDQTEESTRGLRMQYMMQKIDEDTFKKTLQQIEKDKTKKRDFNNIYQMFVDVSSDIYRQLVVCYNENRKNHFAKHEIIKNFFQENIIILSNLRNYFNDNLKKSGNTYKCVYPGISDTYRFQHNYKTFLERNNQN